MYVNVGMSDTPQYMEMIKKLHYSTVALSNWAIQQCKAEVDTGVQHYSDNRCHGAPTQNGLEPLSNLSKQAMTDKFYLNCKFSFVPCLQFHHTVNKKCFPPLYVQINTNIAN